MEKIQFSYRVPKKLLNHIKIDAIEKNISISDNITRFIIQGLKLEINFNQEEINEILEEILALEPYHTLRSGKHEKRWKNKNAY